MITEPRTDLGLSCPFGNLFLTATPVPGPGLRQGSARGNVLRGPGPYLPPTHTQGNATHVRSILQAGMKEVGLSGPGPLICTKRGRDVRLKIINCMVVRPHHSVAAGN